MVSEIQSEASRMGLDSLGSGKLSFDKAIESFESIFIAQIVRGLREAFSEELSDDGGGYGKGIYMSWFDQSLSDAIAKAGGLGLKEQLEKALPVEDKNNSLNQKEIPDNKGPHKRRINIYE